MNALPNCNGLGISVNVSLTSQLTRDIALQLIWPSHSTTIVENRSLDSLTVPNFIK